MNHDPLTEGRQTRQDVRDEIPVVENESTEVQTTLVTKDMTPLTTLYIEHMKLKKVERVFEVT